MYQTTIHTVAQTGESLAELAYRQLEEMIVTLKLEPGSIVNERALTDITGMGRTPVREAVQKLAWEGLMEIRPRSGIAIAPLNLQDFGKILDTREGVERVLARDAARYGGALHHKRLKEASDAMSAALASDDVCRFLIADKIFDTVLAQAAENPFAARLASPLQTHSRRFWFRLQRPGSLQQSGGAHKALIDAIIAGAPDRASEEATKLIDHLRTLAP
ncbi:DNA-binding GntR family transcriptional regulator [Phyllobacterium sp. 1468]|uniref:GntR family transcriptional regulator n=1 Tax=Phyllobacterium sp. 1468 TaxID=2817759 RepID=UPI00285AECE6|nr:GntR family transcriptional regulator [Phyllobacterium sp. 1468]MDR6631536.1 DNA-binding GntR family transcriptional regulator [Phyllobacterium sp. 1468]